MRSTREMIPNNIQTNKETKTNDKNGDVVITKWRMKGGGGKCSVQLEFNINTKNLSSNLRHAKRLKKKKKLQSFPFVHIFIPIFFKITLSLQLILFLA